MAKGGNNQRSNGSRFSKPYDTSNVSTMVDATRFAGNAENRSWPMVVHFNDLPERFKRYMVVFVHLRRTLHPRGLTQCF